MIETIATSCEINPNYRGFQHARQDIAIPSIGWSRTLDILAALLLLVFLAPLMVVIAAVIFAADPGPVFFAHRRIGRGGMTFSCFKFRTMVADADVQLARLLERDPEARNEWDRDHKLRNDPRVISCGILLRRLSLDELPQLFNILLGTMSLVGPRPIVEAEVRRYGRYFDHYCCVRPGLTGLWQVSGRNAVSYRRRIAIDVHYVRRRSSKLDLWILTRTISCVIRRTGH